jgi:hypothetical protein
VQLRRRLALVLASTLLGPTAGAAPESTAGQLHRRGVHCMEVLERPECAIDRFEELLAEDTRERALLTDAILRLVKLYRRAGRDDELRAVLRRFWEAGGGRRQREGHLPYSARFLPEGLDFIAHVDIQAALSSELAARMPFELSEAVTACDELRQRQLSDLWLVRRAQRRAAERGISTQAAIESLHREEQERRRRYEERARQREDAGRTSDPPVFGAAICPVARALGMDSTATWTRAAFAVDHRDSRRSAAIVEIPGLAAKIDAAVAAGALAPTPSGRLRLVGHSYAGAPVELVSLDLDQLLIAPAALMPEIATAAASGRATLNRQVKRLISGIPLGASFFAVTTGEALSALSLGGVQGTKRRLLEALLPRPTGLQVAGVAHEYFGVFIRMPTDNPLKASALVDLATKLLDSSESDEGTRALVSGLDLAQASDRQALLISYVASPAELEELALR